MLKRFVQAFAKAATKLVDFSVLNGPRLKPHKRSFVVIHFSQRAVQLRHLFDDMLSLLVQLRVKQGNFLAHLIVQTILELLLVARQVFLAKPFKPTKKTAERVNRRVEIGTLFTELP